jgi:cellulose synthase/poly-beta-1,6-N-acetylglucosamine synthase-like glycosyltransferase
MDKYNKPHTCDLLKDNGSFTIRDPLLVSIGIPAYNEEKNIGACLEALLQQETQKCRILEILVVSSGSTDRTDSIVSEYCIKYPHILLIKEESRRGKASAINELLRVAVGDIMILQSGDTVSENTTVEQLISPFLDGEIGMVGAKIAPVNDNAGFIGFAVHRLWALHHLISLRNPKCGEMVAFRNIIAEIPLNSAVDEAAIEAIITQNNLKLFYAEKAIVYNKGPENLADFIKQRRRIAAGHYHLGKTLGYRVATADTSRIFKLLFKDIELTPRNIINSCLLALLEAWCRMLGFVDFHFTGKNPYVWDVALTTKELKKK